MQYEYERSQYLNAYLVCIMFKCAHSIPKKENKIENKTTEIYKHTHTHTHQIKEWERDLEQGKMSNNKIDLHVWFSLLVSWNALTINTPLSACACLDSVLFTFISLFLFFLLSIIVVYGLSIQYDFMCTTHNCTVNLINCCVYTRAHRAHIQTKYLIKFVPFVAQLICKF